MKQKGQKKMRILTEDDVSSPISNPPNNRRYENVMLNSSKMSSAPPESSEYDDQNGETDAVEAKQTLTFNDEIIKNVKDIPKLLKNNVVELQCYPQDRISLFPIYSKYNLVVFVKSGNKTGYCVHLGSKKYYKARKYFVYILKLFHKLFDMKLHSLLTLKIYNSKSTQLFCISIFLPK